LKFRRLKIPELVCRESNFISLAAAVVKKITNFHDFLFQLKYYSTMPRNRLTNGQKLAIITDTNQRLNQNESLKSIARSHNVQPVQIRKWKRQLNPLTAKKKSKKSISSGRPGRLKDFC
jgi:hypothetical protein